MITPAEQLESGEFVKPLDDHEPPTSLRSKRSWITGRAAIALYRVFVIIGFLAVWQLISVTKLIDPFFISSPTKIGALFWDFLLMNDTGRAGGGTIYRDALVTLREAAYGFACGVSLGTIIGFGLGQSRLLSKIFLPLLNLINTLPRVALAPLFILWFGLGELSKVVLVFTVVVVILIFNTYAGTQTVSRDIITSARLLGANRLEIVRKVTLPWCVPWIFAGMRIGLAWSLGAAVVGEYLAATEGLGYRTFFYAGILDQTGLFASLLFLLIISGMFFAILGVVERFVLRWRPERL